MNTFRKKTNLFCFKLFIYIFLKCIFTVIPQDQYKTKTVHSHSRMALHLFLIVCDSYLEHILFSKLSQLLVNSTEQNFTDCKNF